MAKRKKLEDLVNKGQGIEALAALSDLPADETKQNSDNLEVEPGRKRRRKHIADTPDLGQDFAEAEDLPEVETKPEPEEKPFEPKFDITAIVAEEDDLNAIQGLTVGRKNYLVAWQAYTSEKDKLQSHFELGSPITFEISCAASKIFAQLKTKFRIEIITYDMRTLQPQKSYSLVKDRQMKSRYFQITSSTETVQKGLFNFHVILSIQNTDLFQVCEGNYFQVV